MDVSQIKETPQLTGIKDFDALYYRSTCVQEYVGHTGSTNTECIQVRIQENINPFPHDLYLPNHIATYVDA